MSRDVALTLGHLLSDRPLAEIVPLIKDDGSLRDRALLYGLGMRHSAALHGIALDDDRSPVPARRGAVVDAARRRHPGLSPGRCELRSAIAVMTPAQRLHDGRRWTRGHLRYG